MLALYAYQGFILMRARGSFSLGLGWLDGVFAVPFSESEKLPSFQMSREVELATSLSSSARGPCCSGPRYLYCYDIPKTTAGKRDARTSYPQIGLLAQEDVR